MLLVCSQVEGRGCEVVMVTFSLIGRIDEAGVNLLGSYGGGSGVTSSKEQRNFSLSLDKDGAGNLNSSNSRAKSGKVLARIRVDR